jgi:glycolate oxidase iron-sulfur subunit
MQTTFTAEQLRDPDTAEANKILRTCVHCGMCTATCPTFLLLGDELDSPRGRIYLIKDMLENARPASELEVRHVDRCLSCLSCMTTCPSGVHYMHLVDHARRHIEDTYVRPWPERLLRQVLVRVLPNPTLFRLSLRAAALARPLGRLIPGRSLMAQRMRAMLALAPAALPPRTASQEARIHPAEGTRRGRVGLLTGCAQKVLNPAINEATIRLLTRMGVEVVVTPARAAAARSPTTWASTTRRWRPRAPTSPPGRPSSWTPSWSTPRAAAPPSRITATCSARSRRPPPPPASRRSPWT